MIIDMPDATTTAVNKKLDELRERVGAVAMGRALTLIIAPDSEEILEESLKAANDASHEHPSRIIVTLRGNPYADKPRLDAQLRAGGDTGASEVVVLWLSGALSGHAASGSTPLVASVMRRIANRPNGSCAGTAGDTDLAWARITYWRALLAAAVDLAPHEPIESALVSGLKTEPALDVLAGWLASRIDGPVRRAVGELKVELARSSETIVLSRPQEGRTATLSRTSRPDALLPLARRETGECLAEDLRRLDADEIYQSALEGIEKVQYV